MKKYINPLFILIIILSFSTRSSAQSTAEKAKTHFSKYLTKKSINDLAMKSLPTLEECKKVYKDADAATYSSMIEGMKKEMGTQQITDDETFVDLSIETFTTKDVLDGKGNYAGGMTSIVNKLKENVTFYKVEQLRQKGAENGVAYKYWVNINSRWVFFPKMWSAFKK
jgi:hypothetical protein